MLLESTTEIHVCFAITPVDSLLDFLTRLNSQMRTKSWVWRSAAASSPSWSSCTAPSEVSWIWKASFSRSLRCSATRESGCGIRITFLVSSFESQSAVGFILFSIKKNSSWSFLSYCHGMIDSLQFANSFVSGQISFDQYLLWEINEEIPDIDNHGIGECTDATHQACSILWFEPSTHVAHQASTMKINRTISWQNVLIPSVICMSRPSAKPFAVTSSCYFTNIARFKV